MPDATSLLRVGKPNFAMEALTRGLNQSYFFGQIFDFFKIKKRLVHKKYTVN
jgi:hypothetical protein